MYRNILFDFDGTISDTSKGAIKGFKYVMDEFNLDYSKMDLKEFIGPTLQESFKKFCGFKEEQILKAIKIFREYYNKIGLYESEMYMGIDKVLEELYNNKCNLYIASTKPTIFIKELLRNYELSKYFKDISGSPLEGKSIQKDMAISKIIKKYNLNRKETVMVGDRKYDIIGAKQNKIQSIGVQYGMGTLEELKQFNPEYIISTPKEVLNIILE